MPSSAALPFVLANFSQFRLEPHVEKAIRNAWSLSGGQPLNASHLLEGALVVAEGSSAMTSTSKAFRQLASLIRLYSRTGIDVKTDVPPLDLNALPLIKPLADSFIVAVALSFLKEGEAVWGRDYITLALLAKDDSSLTNLAIEANSSVKAIQDSWFNFVSSTEEYRNVQSWERWWRSAGVPLPTTTIPNGPMRFNFFEWDPTTDPFPKLEEYAKTIEKKGFCDFPWSAENNTRNINPGHEVFLLKKDGERGGLVAVGEVQGTAMEAPDLDSVKRASGETSPLTNVRWTALSREPFLDQVHLDRELKGALSSSLRGPAGSEVPIRVAQRLDELWPRAWGEYLLARRAVLAAADEALVSGPAGFYPEFRAVGLDGDVVDYLDVEAEANRLADLIALRETNLPLAVGLFANWGSGKSHFMGLLRMHMLNRASAARGKNGTTDERWCKEIVPIVFNAWHYLDSNLWASLVSEIFERLFEHLQPKGDTLQQVQEKLREVGGAMARAQEEVVLTQAAVTKAAGELENAQRQAAQAQTVYAGMVDRFQELLPEFKKQIGLERIAELLGVAPEMAKLSELKKKNEELTTVPGQVRELWQRMKAPQGRMYRVGWLLLAIVIGPLLLWAMQKVIPGFANWLKNVGGWVKPVLQSFIVMLTALTPFVTTLQLRLREMRDLQKQAEDAQKRKETASEVVKAKEELAAKKALATQAELQLAETATRQKQLEKEAEELAPGRRVSRFIEDRAHSMDYRGQLGLVSLARRDFEELSNLFTGKEALEEKIKKLNEEAKKLEESGKEAAKAEAERLRKEAKSLPKFFDSVDRIVLFVDDLDRCQPERVVEILQAVHLLLAFPLFAVIVGVDQRSLRKSLQEQFKGLVADSTQPHGDEFPATPLDYLEKIFHVPFHLPRMDTDGFGKLIWNLSAPHSDREEPIKKQEDKTTPVAPEQATGTDLPAPPIPPPPLTPAPAVPAPVPVAVKPAPILLGSVPLQDWERKALKRYHALISTPRAAIRLLNTYRLVRAGLTDEEWTRFRYDGNRRGESEIVMLLLAVAAGYPSIVRDWFAALHRAGGATWEIGPKDELRKDGRWPDLDAALDRFDKQTGVSEEEKNERQSWLPELPMLEKNEKPVLHRWLPRVERFAF